MLLKAKCDHIHHACTHGFVPTWWKWSQRAFSLLTAYQILSADFYFQEPLTTAWIRVTIQHLQKKERGAALCYLLPGCSDHMFIISQYEVDHMWWLVCSFFALSAFTLRSLAFLFCRRSKFRAHLPSENKTTYQSFVTRIWPHLWPYTDLEYTETRCHESMKKPFLRSRKG